MPKPSMEAMLPDAAVESTGALAGKFEVLGAVYKVHKDKEYEPKPGQKPRTDRDGNPLRNDPMMALVMKVAPCAEDGSSLDDADSRDIVLKMGGKSLLTFHPGKGDSPEDTDPDDLGDELNTEGNTLFIAGGEVSMNAKSSYTVFMRSLQHVGFPKEKIAECWAPNFKGLRFELATVTPDKLEQYGQKKGEGNKDGENITYKVVAGLIAAKGKKGGDKGKAEKEEKPAEKSSKKAKPVDDDDDEVKGSAGGNEAEAEALRVLGAVVTRLAGKNKKLDQTKTFWVTMYADPKVKGSAKLMGDARKFINDESWLVEQLEDLDCVVDIDEKTVTFAA